MIKKCIICGKEFETTRNAKTCSNACRAEAIKNIKESIADLIGTLSRISKKSITITDFKENRLMRILLWVR